MDNRQAAVSAPCLGCEKRFIGCHSVCDEYTRYHSVRNRMLEKKRNGLRGGCALAAKAKLLKARRNQGKGLLLRWASESRRCW